MRQLPRSQEYSFYQFHKYRWKMSDPTAPPSTPLNYFKQPPSPTQRPSTALPNIPVATAATVPSLPSGGSARTKPRRRRRSRRQSSRVIIPRSLRVYRTCTKCGARNHNRRLFCQSCFASKAEMAKKDWISIDTAVSCGYGSVPFFLNKFRAFLSSKN